MGKILTPEEAAEELKVSTWTVYNWLKEGKIPGRKLGRYWRIPADALVHSLLREPQDGNAADDDRPAPGELAEEKSAWADYLAGRDPGKPLDQVWREQIEERRD